MNADKAQKNKSADQAVLTDGTSLITMIKAISAILFSICLKVTRPNQVTL